MTTTFTALLMLILSLGTSCCSTDGAVALAVRAAQAPPAPEAGGLALDVKATKSVYAKNEPVVLDITLRNSGKSSQVVARRLSVGTRIKLAILSPDGTSAKRCGPISDEIVVVSGNYKTLPPGDFERQRLVISCDSAKDSRTPGYIFDHPGKYVIKAAYLLPVPKEEYKRAFPNVDVIQGPVWAEPITIQVR